MLGMTGDDDEQPARSSAGFQLALRTAGEEGVILTE